MNAVTYPLGRGRGKEEKRKKNYSTLKGGKRIRKKKNPRSSTPQRAEGKGKRKGIHWLVGAADQRGGEEEMSAPPPLSP